MKLEETIYKRQSIREYDQKPLNEQTINEIEEFISESKVLNENIEWSYDIVSKQKIKTLLPWKAPQYLLLFSEEKENYKENIGFIFQQTDLYLQSKGIGTCWLGMASPNSKYQQKNKNQKFIISISIGKSTSPIDRKINEFNRKELEEISDKNDEKLKPAQYAPSAMNSQPWYFTHNDDDTYNIYREKLNIIKRNVVGRWNQIDIGIALAHIYIENQNTFHFYMKDKPEKLKKYIYEGTFEI